MPKLPLSLVLVACLASAVLGAAVHRSGGFPIPQLRAVKTALLPQASAPQPSYKTVSDAYDLQAQLFDLVPASKVVMVGDSITAFAPWSDMFPTVRPSNRGIGNDTTAGLLSRLDSILISHPKKMFLMIGINDVLHNTDTSISLENYRQIVQATITAGTRLYAQSVLFTTVAALNQHVTSLNEGISGICSSVATCKYIDLNGQLAPSGALAYPLVGDDIHISPAGYMIWRDRINPLVTE
jgi:hypothetical protein